MEIFSESLLGELHHFDSKMKGEKAHRVYSKCLRRGHPKIAEAIRRKYGRQFPQHDSVIAFGFALMAQEHGKQS